MGGRGSGSNGKRTTVDKIVARSYVPTAERMSQEQADRERERLQRAAEKAEDGSFEKRMAEAKLETLNEIKPARDNTSFSTSEAVERLNNALKGDGGRREARAALEGIREGQQITVYSKTYQNGVEQKDVIENPIIWTKRDDGTWSSNTGRRMDNSDLLRSLDQGGRNVASGAVTTESRTTITGRFGRDMNGFRFAKGNFDVYRVSPTTGGREKVSQAGQITAYNGVQYGIHRDRDGYHITHIPTGLSINAAREYPKTMTAVTEYIQRMHDTVQNVSGLKEMEERFKKTRRGD